MWYLYRMKILLKISSSVDKLVRKDTDMSLHVMQLTVHLDYSTALTLPKLTEPLTVGSLPAMSDPANKLVQSDTDMHIHLI